MRISVDRLRELREATEGSGARHRQHRLSNDELVELLATYAQTGSAAGLGGVELCVSGSITDEQLRELRDEARELRDFDTLTDAKIALSEHTHYSDEFRAQCRARCARIFKARGDR